MSSPQPLPFPAPSFDVVLRGYDRTTVDALVSRAYATLLDETLPKRTFALAPWLSLDGADPLTVSELRAARIDVVLRGYDRAQVEDLLNSVEGHLARAESRNGRQ
ncbi:hypothetical protein BJF83_21045 [Nocardiopsis sp. CNR-923]|uniref:DivIVA domain-containing protein n=1 Tax=Nocardiopsis sp. CNR-923 TaxID=1904965 RepID=UPI000963A2E7|nr:DivIVA domain-containing protein [Nocardiopsis sp. CNR-923]OLT26497.1 hypothetical protein BJF83_21045 [Nocardiopsis sp. CNR-923]